MSHALYTALSGAVAQERALEVVADNLANVSTSGFKATRLTFEQIFDGSGAQPAISLAEVQAQMRQERLEAARTGADMQALERAETQRLEHPDGGARRAHVQVQVSGGYLDMSQGPLKTTHNVLDFALTGPGFFSVETPMGERLTRQGSFVVAPDGTLSTLLGHAVQGQGGAIKVHPEAELTSDAQGAIFADGAYVDSLRRVNVASSKSLQRRGDALFSVAPGSRVDAVQTPVAPGHLEQSNVNPVGAMTQLIAVQRAYESYHRAMENVRSLEQKTSSELG